MLATALEHELLVYRKVKSVLPHEKFLFSFQINLDNFDYENVNIKKADYWIMYVVDTN